MSFECSNAVVKLKLGRQGVLDKWNHNTEGALCQIGVGSMTIIAEHQMTTVPMLAHEFVPGH